MNPALKKRCAEIQACFARAAKDDVEARHAIGRLLVDTRTNQHMYGRHAVLDLSVALRRPVSTLYRYAAVAERWSADEMRALLERLDASGAPLSWSHWVELAQVQSSAELERLMAHALVERLSVRQLAALVRAGQTSTAVDSVDGCGENVAHAVEKAARACEQWSSHALAAVETIAIRARTSERHDAALATEIARAVRAHEAVRQRSEEALCVLRRALDALSPRVPAVQTVERGHDANAIA